MIYQLARRIKFVPHRAACCRVGRSRARWEKSDRAVQRTRAKSVDGLGCATARTIVGVQRDTDVEGTGTDEVDEVDEAVAAFALTSRRAVESGCDGVHIYMV